MEATVQEAAQENVDEQEGNGERSRVAQKKKLPFTDY